MSVRSGQSITVDFVTQRFDTGNATAADSTPTGTLVVNGTDDAASVTVTSKSGGKYKAAVTLPTLAIGDVVQLRIAATVNSVSGVGIVWTDTKDVLIDSSGNVAVPDTQKVDVNTIKTNAVVNGGTITFPTGATLASTTNITAASGVALSSAGVQAIWDALSSALTTVGSIGKRLVDYLTGDIYGLIGATGSGLTSLAQASAWTGTRAAYLDKLNISGNVAASSEVTAIQNNTTTSLIAPTNIIRPTSGTLTAKIVVYLTDEIGNMEAPDSAPTLSVFNAAGTDLSARLASTTGTLTATGVYTWVYTSSSTDDAEEILFTVTVIEGGVTRYKGATSWITDNASTDFTSSDRTKLNAVYAKLPTNNIADQTLLNTAISNVASQTDQLTFGTYGVLADMRGIANHATAVDTGTAGVVSFVSGAYVMTSGDTVSANIVQVGGENITDDGNGRMEVVADPVVADISSRIPDALTGDGNMKADTLKVNGQTPQTLPTIVSFSAG